jgi:type I restriction enzyme S subunit
MSSKTKTTATKEESTPALVPKLRFPEFRGAVAWHQGRIADIAVSESSSRALNKLSLKSEGYPVYGADSCVGFIDSFDQSDDYIAIVKDGSGVGRLALKRGKSSVLGTLAYIKCKPGSEAKLTWLYYCLNSVDLRQFVKGSGIPHIYFSDYAAQNVLISTSSEQQKIAECLSSVDELMAAQARKVDALKTHKKGLMQQLFPGDGEVQPQLRFPEFLKSGNWHVKILGSIGRVIRGASPRPQGDPRYYGGPVPRLMVQDVTRDGKWVTPRIDSLTFEGAKLSRPCPAGTLTIVCSGTVGVVSFLAVDACIHDGFLALIDIDETIATKDFLYHSLGTLRLQFEEGATHGGVFTNLTTSGIDRFEIKCPTSSEQKRIADFLSSLDALITAETQKLDAFKTHKKALMQKLFPSPEAVEV